MKKNKKIIISNHTDKFIEWYDLILKHGYTKDDVVIYDRDHLEFNGENLDPCRLIKYGTVIKSPNVGSNIYDIGRYIFDNYDNLPDIMIFLKCNLLQRTYTTQERFEYALDSDYFVPIGPDVNNNPYGSPFTINDGFIIAKVSDEDWIAPDCKLYPRVKCLSEFIKDIFDIQKVPDYLMFCPGGNYNVPKEYILKYSKNFYKKWMVYTDYNNNPHEAHWFERIMQMAWQGCLKENTSYIL